MDGEKLSGQTLNLNVEHLAAAINAGFGVHAVGAEGATIGVFSKFRCDESVGGAAISAAALGLFAFRVSHRK